MNKPSHILALACTAALAPSAGAAPPFITDDPDSTPQRTYEIYLFDTAAKADDAVNGSYGVDFNYGAGPDLQVSATLPVSYQRLRSGPFSSGLGNIELAVKYRFLHQEHVGWSAAIFPRIFLPSGSDLGERHASLLLPLWVGRDGDQWSTFGGGGCALNHGGDSRNYCVAGWVLSRRVLQALQVGGELFHQTSDAKGGHASTILGLGTTYDLSQNIHVLGYLGAGLQNQSKTARGTGYTSVLFTF